MFERVLTRNNQYQYNTAEHNKLNLSLSTYFIGVYDKGSLEVTNCFAVPHNESEDEVRDCKGRQSGDSFRP